MFTGIVQEVGAVRELSSKGKAWRLSIESQGVGRALRIGDSLSVNGVCLSMTEKRARLVSFDVMPETMRTTTLKGLQKNDTVNLEGPLRVGDPLGGHFVLGHVDCVVTIRDMRNMGDEVWIDLEIPREFIPCVVRKGSIALDGVSLTVGEAEKGRVRVYLIPHTLKATTLGSKRVGDGLNCEFDIIGKHVRRFQNLDKEETITEGFLRERGFH